MSVFLDLGVGDLKKWASTNTIDKSIQIELAMQLFSALRYIHSKGCLHRDIKPQNVIVFEEYTGPRFVLSDFGLARGTDIVTPNNAFTTGVCTLWYRAPELLLHYTTYGAEVDVWSMGCTLYELAEDNPLFTGVSESDQLNEIFKVTGTPSMIPNVPVHRGILQYFSSKHKLCKLTVKVVELCIVVDPNLRSDSETIYNMIVSM